MVMIQSMREDRWMRCRRARGLKACARILLAWWWLVPLSGMAADQNASIRYTLEAINVTALPGNRLQIRLTMDGPTPLPRPLSFTIDNPARIALDFPHTASRIPKRQPVEAGVARSINAVEANGRTRIVLNLVRLVPYETRVEGNSILISLGGDTGMEVAPAPALAKRAGGRAEEPRHGITKIDFRRGKSGEGRIIVSLSDSATPVSIHREGTKLEVDFMDTELPKSLERRLDVVDFATPVTLVDTFTRDGVTRMEVTAQGDYDHLAYQSDRIFTLEVKPVSKAKKGGAGKEKTGYSGEKLSLNFQDIEVRAVLQLIADFTGLNLVTSDTVKGNITLRLNNVPWDQALDIILKSKGLAMRRMNNVILVAPSEEIAAREKQEFESRQQFQELAPLRSQLIQVNYAKAADIAALLKAKQNSMLSERGHVTLDERTNTLLVRDTADKLEEIARLVSKLDIPVRQVLIESRIVIANDDFSRDLGVRFGATGVTKNGDNDVLGVSGTLEGTDDIVNNAPLPVNVPKLENRLNVSLPVNNPTGKIALAVLGSDFLVDLELSAMQAEGRGELISSPRVITSNQTKARVEQGVDIPFQEASSSGATSVSFKKAVLSLEVRPQITPDNRVIMDLEVNKDNVGKLFNGVPSIDTRAVSTQVLVDNGETVVLGGIYEQTRRHEVDSVPLLGKIPVVGALFRQTRKVNNKAELLIFITPKILKESLRLK